jgi:hypothetical protein
LAVYEGLDKKLEDLARTSLTIGGIVATLTKAADLGSTPWRFWMIVLGIVVTVVTVAVAYLSRRPINTTMSMDARTLLEVADLPKGFPESKVNAVIAASYHVASIGLQPGLVWKTKQLHRLTWLFCASLLLFALAVIVPTVNGSSDQKPVHSDASSLKSWPFQPGPRSSAGSSGPASR